RHVLWRRRHRLHVKASIAAEGVVEGLRLAGRRSDEHGDGGGSVCGVGRCIPGHDDLLWRWNGGRRPIDEPSQIDGVLRSSYRPSSVVYLWASELLLSAFGSIVASSSPGAVYGRAAPGVSTSVNDASAALRAANNSTGTAHVTSGGSPSVSSDSTASSVSPPPSSSASARSRIVSASS